MVVVDFVVVVGLGQLGVVVVLVVVVVVLVVVVDFVVVVGVGLAGPTGRTDVVQSSHSAVVVGLTWLGVVVVGLT